MLLPRFSAKRTALQDHLDLGGDGRLPSFLSSYPSGPRPQEDHLHTPETSALGSQKWGSDDAGKATDSKQPLPGSQTTATAHDELSAQRPAQQLPQAGFRRPWSSPGRSAGTMVLSVNGEDPSTPGQAARVQRARRLLCARPFRPQQLLVRDCTCQVEASPGGGYSSSWGTGACGRPDTWKACPGPGQPEEKTSMERACLPSRQPWLRPWL